MKQLLCCFYLIIAVVLPSALTYAQANSYFNQRDDKYRLLGLKRAKEAYEFSRKEFERQQDLHKKGLLSNAELDRAKVSFSDAEVNYQQSLLAVLFETQFISVEKAVKYQTPDGKKHVRITLINTSGGNAEFQKLIKMEDHLFRSLQPDVIPNIYVSIANTDNSIISQPYEAKIEELRFGHPRELDFVLLQDLDAVVVNVIYGNGSSRTMKIFLQKDASQNRVIVQSQQFSQEAELGKTATYDLTLELFSGTTNTFALEVINLPQQLNRYFKDPQTQARLSQFKFLENANTRRAVLDVSLPDRPSSEIQMDKPIPFFVLVIPRDRLNEIKNIASPHWNQEEIEKLQIGFVKLELVPRGKGRLLVRAQQLFHSIRTDGKIQLSIELVNEGTRRLDNVKIEADVPLDWTKRIEPMMIQSLEISEEKRITLEFTPPVTIAPGRYEIRLRTTALTDNQPLNGEDKTITAEIQAEANVFGTIIVVLLILGVVGGIVWYGIKLSKR
ncbi:MAG: NEW3 domain-containing protein [Bacteriovoracaceae bacterium]